MNISSDISERAKSIRLALFDVDGVLTDGNIYIDSNGAELKVFNTHDGHGIRRCGQPLLRYAAAQVSGLDPFIQRRRLGLWWQAQFGFECPDTGLILA